MTAPCLVKPCITEKSNMATKLIFSILLISTISGTVLSQKWCLQLTPGYYSSFGTFRIKQTSPNSAINLMNKKWPHVRWSQASFAWDLNLLKWNRHYFGVCYNIGTATNSLKYHYVANYTLDTTANTTEFFLRHGMSTFIQQYGIFYRFRMNMPELDSSIIGHNFSFYIHYLDDFSNFMPMYDTYHKMTDGGIIDDFENYPDLYENRKGFAIALRYDIGFYTRKKHKNILNVFVAYQQGFRLMNRITLEVFHENGAYLSANSTSYGSFFSAGIAKPINLYPNRWWPKH